MAAVMDVMTEQAWETAAKAEIRPDEFSFEDEGADYPIAEICTGPRPPSVPRAELFGIACHTFSHSCKRPSFPLSSDVVENQLSDGFVNDITSDSRLGIRCGLLQQLVENAADVSAHNLTHEAADDALVVAPKNTGSPDAGDVSFVGFDGVNYTAWPLGGWTEGIAARDISLENLSACIQLESGESLPYSELENHYSSGQPDPFERQSSASHSSSNSCSGELVAGRVPKSCSPNVGPRKKGECFLCTKVNRVSGKETCLVCSAKYCRHCVLKAMGSMPEGRKCSGCVGNTIHESSRQELGKPSRMLCRLLSKLEVQQIMKAERECPANQLHPEQLYVNGRSLTGKEFDELLGCALPPSKLKPGRYWYDAECGYWGKEGEKPEDIISVKLNIGGDLLENASAGSTGVYINNREITRRELKMLKFAGFHFPPQTRLWVEADGTCMGEGHNNRYGNIYEKKRARLLCHLLSLPLPKTCTTARELSNSTHAYYKQNVASTILLAGHVGSGTSTIMKQIRFLYKNNLTTEELQDIKVLIQQNIWKCLIILLEARERFEDEENNVIKQVERNNSSSSSGETESEPQSANKNIFALTPLLTNHAAWLLEADAMGELEKSEVNQERAAVVEKLWRDPAVQATYKRVAEKCLLPNAAEYFLEKVVSIANNGYLPSRRDILLAGAVTNDLELAEIQFASDDDAVLSWPFPQSLDRLLLESRFHLIRIHGSGINKLLKLFDDVEAVLFCVALDSYDELWPNGNDPLQNKMLLSRNLFESIIKYPFFRHKPVVLLLNKYDAFEKKVSVVPLAACEWFSDFSPVKRTNQLLAQHAFTYIAHKFKQHFQMLNPSDDKGKIFAFKLNALEESSVAEALQYVKAVLLWEMTKKQGLLSTSFDNTETSSL